MKTMHKSNDNKLKLSASTSSLIKGLIGGVYYSRDQNKKRDKKSMQSEDIKYNQEAAMKRFTRNSPAPHLVSWTLISCILSVTLILSICLQFEGVQGANLQVKRLIKRQVESETPISTTPKTTHEPNTSSSESGSSVVNNNEVTSATTEKAKTKIPPVNFTLIEEEWDAISGDDEVVTKWRHMDKQMTDGIRTILKIVFPHVVAMSSDAKVSGQCSGAILKWILNLRNLRSWAVKMLDASGKPSSGLLGGSLTMFGNYRECLSIRAPDEDEIEIVDEFREYFRGQYCVLEMKPHLPKKRPFYTLNSTIPSLLRKNYKYYEKTVYDDLAELAMAFNYLNIRADLCAPSLCSRDDIQRVATYLATKADMKAKVLRCDVEDIDTEATILDENLLIWSLIFIIILLLVIISTLSGFIMKLRNKSKSKLYSLCTSMSLTRSLSHMKNVHIDRINDSKPAFLYSIRLLIILWILLVNLVNQLEFKFLRELLTLRDVLQTWPMQLIVNSTLQFDTLILLTAFTYSYQTINSNLKDLVKYNISKYSRLMPSIMLFVAITIITPILYRYQSPIWHDFVDKQAITCKSTGFINLFFLQNLLDYEQICLPQTWIFCVELQLCILAIPIVYLFNKEFDQNHGQFKLITLPNIILIVITVIGCTINFSTIYQNSLPAAWLLSYPDKEDKNLYFSLYLYKTWTHLTTFAIGLFTGHLCRCQSIETFSGRPYGRKSCSSLMWLTSLSFMGIIIYSTYPWSLDGNSHLESPILSAFYGSFGQFFWSISWSLILFNLTVPNDKNQRSTFCNLLTCDNNLVRLGRLSFLAYLINPYVNTFILAAQEQAIFSSILMISHTFIGNLVITFALAIVVSALIELPCRRLIKKLALGSRRQCTNFGIITRQLNIRSQNQSPTSHDSFLADHKQAHSLNPATIPLKSNKS